VAIRLHASFVFSTLLIFICVLPAVSDDAKTSNPQDLKTTPFTALQEERDQLADTIRTQDAALTNLKTNIDWRNTEAQVQQKLDVAIKNKAQPKEIADLQKEVLVDHGYGGYPKTDSDLKKAAEDAVKDIASARKRKGEIEQEMNRRLEVEIPKQSFRTNMSLAFTVLVGLVIVGFYLLAWLDQVLRREMFSRQSGIQFITLFSLVIAIILFGITGILESRELSALLGGLSGYILGRSGGSENKLAKDPSPAPEPKPVV
jgi:hypothetical protein